MHMVNLDEIYNECLEIIENSNDSNIKKKKNKLVASYKLMIDSDDNDNQDFRSVVYEIRLYNYIKNLGLNIQAQNDDKGGPDFLVPEKCYIECIISTTGKEEIISIPQNKGIGSTTTNDHRLGISRLSNSFITKSEKYKCYLKKDKIQSKLPLVIAIDSSILCYRTFSKIVFENMKKVLYGIGDYQYYINSNGIPVLSECRAYTSTIFKKGKEINISYFMNEDYSHISAVIFNCHHIKDPFCKDNIMLFLNPYANYPLDINFFKDLKKFGLIESDYATNKVTFGEL